MELFSGGVISTNSSILDFLGFLQSPSQTRKSPVHETVNELKYGKRISFSNSEIRLTREIMSRNRERSRTHAVQSRRKLNFSPPHTCSGAAQSFG